MTKIVTHDSNFHADDIFAVATLLLVLGEAEIVRSRNPEIQATADYLVDTGEKYDPSTHHFDHHQAEGAGARDNGIPYASFGLVWKEYGEKVSGDKKISDFIDKRLVQSIDAWDNGVATSTDKFDGVRSYTIGDFFNSYLIGENTSEEELYKVFMSNVEIAKGILIREIKRAGIFIKAEELFENLYNSSADRRLIEVPEENLSWEVIAQHFPETLYIIYPRRNGTWGLKAVPDPVKGHGYQKKSLPQDWGGKRDEELQRVTGVDDAIFTHRKLFTAGAKSKEGALKLAEKALNA